jgi:hypothetical protein
MSAGHLVDGDGYSQYRASWKRWPARQTGVVATVMSISGRALLENQHQLIRR